jgi:hypothetical protein
MVASRGVGMARNPTPGVGVDLGIHSTTWGGLTEPRGSATVRIDGRGMLPRDRRETPPPPARRIGRKAEPHRRW